jgi:hypothetical protein
MAIARGRVSVPRHPCSWRSRLYLFYSAKVRTAFFVDPGRITERATRK